jgi:hypothetical protein
VPWKEVGLERMKAYFYEQANSHIKLSDHAGKVTHAVASLECPLVTGKPNLNSCFKIIKRP